MSSGVSCFSSDAAAAPVLSALGKGKWRNARDLAKDLCKKDRARYLPLLIEANAGLAHDLISRGLLSDARTVVDYLKTIAPPALAAALEAALSSPPEPEPATAGSGGHPGAAISRLWPELLRIAANPAGELGCRDITVIDDVVTAFASPPAVADDELSAGLSAQLEAVHAACEAASEGRWEDASEAVRPLPSQSVFRHWRLFLRGMRLSFQGDAGGAAQCFDRLPPGGTCAIAAASMPGRKPSLNIRPAARAAWDLALSGEPAEQGAEIAAADAAWRKGDWTSAKAALTKAIGSGFPSHGHGLAAALTDALFFVGDSREDAVIKRKRQLMGFWDQLCQMERPPRATLAAAMRYLLVSDEPGMPPGPLAKEVGDLLLIESELHGPNPVRDSQGWQWLGEKLSGEDLSRPPLMGAPPRLRDAAGAIRAFESATKSDPENEAAWLGLLGVHEKTRATAKRNRLLDDLVKRFPQNKRVLILAGAMAVERGAFAKGLGFLEQARALDPLDPLVRTQMLVALVQRARDAHQNVKETGSIWEQIEPLLDASPACADLMGAKWVMRVRRALWDSANAPDALADAEKLAPSRLEFLAMESLLSGCYNLPLRKDWQAAWHAVPHVTWSAVSGVFRAISFAEKIDGFKKHATQRAHSLLIESVNFAARDDLFVKDPAGALRVFQQLDRMDKASSYFLGDIADDAMARMNEIVRRLPKNVVAASLPLRLLDLSLRENFDMSLTDAKGRKAVNSFIADAEKAGAGDLVAVARKLLLEYQEGEDSGDFDEEDVPDFGPKEPVSGVLKDFLDAVASGNTKRINKLKKIIENLGLGLPGEKGMGPPGKQAVKAHANPKPKKPKPSGNQEEFGFF
ncbi:MAG: hypothetical protein WCG76_08185 [Verrucomicrobiota bacterium]